jgi:hypothetical protein
LRKDTCLRRGRYRQNLFRMAIHQRVAHLTALCLLCARLACSLSANKSDSLNQISEARRKKDLFFGVVVE